MPAIVQQDVVAPVVHGWVAVAHHTLLHSGVHSASFLSRLGDEGSQGDALPCLAWGNDALAFVKQDVALRQGLQHEFSGPHPAAQWRAHRAHTPEERQGAVCARF
jgi:hypothetical protein